MTNANETDTENNTDSFKLNFDKYFMLGWKWHGLAFLTVLTIVGGALYWFSFTMRANSNVKVSQAKQIIDRSDTLPKKITPLTLRTQEMVVNTEKERNWIIAELSADSFAERFPSKLQDRFLRTSTYYKLPSNWKNKLPSSLEKWAQKHRRNRMRSIKRFFQKLSRTIDENQNRLKRMEKILKKIDAYKVYGNELPRYKTAKNNLKSIMKRVDKAIQNTTISKPDIPDQLFDKITELPDALTKIALHYRRFNALTNAPAAYFYAERYLHDALRIDPNNPDAYFQLGRLYSQLNMKKLSGEQFARALKVDNDYKNSSTIVNRLRSRLKKNPKSPHHRYYLAFTLYELGKTDEAKNELKTVIRMQDDKHTMVKVLAKKRLKYILTGEPPYNKITYF